jgi:hypothetical protein
MNPINAMNEVTKLHNEAMDIYDEVLSHRRVILEKDRAGQEKIKQNLVIAFEKERQAALMLCDKYDIEPTRGVLFRSAATMACQLGLFRDAEKLIAQGLIGDPPDDIVGELRDLLQDIENSLRIAPVAL